MATEFIEISEEEYQGGAGDFIEITEEEFNAPASDVGTSVEQEVSQLGAALKSGIAQPLQAMGVTAETLGMPAVGAALKGAVEQPEGYVPAAQRFMEPQAGEAQLGGFAFQYLPRAIVEQVGQLAGSVASRAAGGVIGGAAGSVVPGAGTAVGAGIGMFTGPALFEAAQIVGPVAQERAKNNGREIPNSEDLAYAWTTAGTSGALNAIGAKYLPGGEKAVGALTKRIAASLLGEGATEGAQALAQQTGETILTEKGLEIKPKAALGEALIGGVSASGATIVMSPLQKEQVDIEKEADLESRDLSIPVDDPVVRANLDKANILEQENKDSLAIINKFGVESEEGKAAQQTIVDNTDEITKLNETLPTGLSLPITTAERQQVELAKAIVEEPAPTEPLPVPPAQAAPVAAPVEQVVTPPVEVAPAPVVSEEGAQVSEITPAPTIGEEADIEAGAPPLGTDNLYFENNLAQRAWRLTAGFKYDKEKGDWFHPDYPNTPRAIAEQEITETNPPSADSVRNTLQQLKVKYGVAEPQAAAIVEPQATEAAQPEPTTFAKGDLVRIPNRVPVYKNGQLVGGRTEMVGASVVQTMPDGKVEVRLQQGGYATLAPNEIESVRKAQPTPAPVTEQAAPAEAPAPEVAKPTGGVDYYKQLGEQDALDTNRKKKRSVPQNFKLAYENGWSDARKKLRAKPSPAVSETITPAAVPAQPTKKTRLDIILDKVENTSSEVTIEVPEKNRTREGIERMIKVANDRGLEASFDGRFILFRPPIREVTSTSKPKLGEKGGVLIPTKEDFIQAGQNIYEAGMEFGAWAKQMVQRFGDAVRQFLADVWEAVSGFPAKLEEMAGYLPGKGERGAVTFGRGEEPPKKPAEPAPEKPAEEKPAMDRYKGKAQVAGVRGIGAEKDTPKGINKKTEEIIKDRVFDATIVNDNQTKKAWNLIQKIEEKNPESGKNAQAINELTRETMQDVEADEVVKQSIGAVKLRNELYSYAIKLAGEGDPKMLNYLLNTRLSIGSGNIVEGDAGRLLQAMASLKSWIVRATEAEQQGFFEIAAQQFFGTKTPTDEQVQQIKNIFNKVKEVKIDQEQELMDELEEVGKAAGVDLPAAVDKQLENTPGLDPMVVAITNMLKMGGTFTYRPTKNKIGEAVKNTINRGITNYRKKIVSKAANGLETGFWKTLSSTEQKPGPLGELDSAQNRALGNIVKQALVKMGLEGTPPDTKMSIYEQVASILGEQPLSQDKIKMADEKIRGGIESKRQAELENATEDQVDAINLKYDEMTIAWDDAMSRSLDMPVSDTMLRRMILNELKEADTSIQDIAKLMEEEPVIGASRQDRYVESIIEKIIGSGRYLTRINEQGKPEADYANLKTYLSDLLENMVLARQQKNKAAKDVAKTKRDASGDPEKQSQAQIDKLAKIKADPTIFGEKRIDPVRNAVRDALSLQLNIGFTPEQSAKIKANWKGAFVADPNKKGIPTSFMLELQRLGVSEAAANTLADIVWRQIEVNAMSRQMDATTKAVEAGPIGGIVQAILDTPLANQQEPEWRKNVILDYLKNAGVKPSQAENIAKLFDVSLRKRFSKAQEEAAIKAAKSIKGGLTANSRRALEKFLKAIRAQVLDPGKDVAKAFAEEMGWKGFTAEQIARLNELDAIFNDTNRTDAEIFTATEQIQKIIDKVSAPPQIKNVLSSLYVGQALLRFTTFAIQGFDPLVFTGVNTAIRSLKNVTSPTQFIQAWADYGTAISNFFRETAYSFKNDTGRSGRMIDYLENEDRKQKRLLNEAVKKFEQGNIPGAMKDAIFGYTAFTFRTLKALDDGAYSLLTSTTLPQYVEAALKNAKIPREKRKGVMRQILKARKLDIDQMVEQGIAKNDAVIYANERMQAAITKELSGLNIDAQEVINSAINDALSRIGKTRFVEDILTGKIEEIKDTGFLSSWFISFYEWAAKAANATEKESQKILYRIMFGFPLIAGRVFNAAAGYTPITLYRHFLNKDRYQLTYGTALQRRQRFIEQMAGTMVLLPLFLLRSNSLDDEEKKKRGFSIYVTGQGPSKLKDKTLHAKWNDAHKPFSMEFDFGKKGKFSIDAKSSGPFSVMIYTLGALDDWEINRKLNDLKTSKNDWREAEAKASIFSTLYEIGGYMLITTARRGPTTGLMQGLVDWRRYPDDPIAAIGAEISFSAMPAVPILGTGALKNLSDFFSQPIDNTTKEGAILANIPIVGPIAGKPALNAYSQKIGELRFSEKLKKSFGIPFTLVVRDSDEDNKLTSITLKNGKGPTPIRREDVENELKSSISDEEWYLAAKTFGDRNKKYVLENYDRYQKMSPTVFGDTISKLASESKKSAIQAVKNQREKTP